MDHSVVITGAAPVGDPRQHMAGPLPVPRSSEPVPRSSEPVHRSCGPVPVRPHAVRPPTSLVCVLLCEDREVFPTGLRVVLEAEPDMAGVAETTHLPEALEAAEGEGAVGGVVRQGLVTVDT